MMICLGLTFAAISVSALPAALAYYIPVDFPFAGGNVHAISNGNSIQAVWGPNGYSTTSFGPGFSSQMRGQFGPNGGSLSNSISRVQVFPAAPGVVGPFF
ncbi:hypothetical protein GGI05_004401 [Coemansia sp. RSA 2603]|nr:hypothetical protein GGI05_004401 [Coemansia sp. RSA 2603]